MGMKGAMMELWAEQALLPEGWTRDVAISVENGRIAAVKTGVAPGGARYGVLLPAPVNLHSHAFQRAMAGLTEARGPDPKDSFWTWRRLMYRFLDHLTPEDIQVIAAQVQMEMLEAGYAAEVEFHYLHHAPGGTPYANIAELSARIAAAAEVTGIGLTLAPVFYQYGGCDGRALAGGQLRFGNDLDRYVRLLEGAEAAISSLPDARIAVAPHSLRAVSREGLAGAAKLRPDAPFHIHLAEQTAEVEEVLAAYGARPVEWLLANADVGPRWCLIHATQMLPQETAALAKTGAVAGLCPITESSLGDGIFDGAGWIAAGGAFGIGSDSNIRIALAEELRTLEYSQRLKERGRAIFATSEASTGRALYAGAVAGGAVAGGRESGAIAVGKLADLTALDSGSLHLAGLSGDRVLDSWIFAGDDRLVSDVWAGGRHVVQGGRHLRHDAISGAFRALVTRLRGDA